MKKLLTLLLLTIPLVSAIGQQTTPMQDSTLNNLVLPAGYTPCTLGDLGVVTKSGSGKQSMILVAGIGFGGEVFDDMVNEYKSKYTVFTVTPAGFSGTQSPPMPDSGTSYGNMTWVRGIVTGVLRLIQEQKLDRPILVTSFVTGTEVGLIFALEHPDKIGKVIIIGGSPYRYYPQRGADGSWNDWGKEAEQTPAQRITISDSYWAPRWFKTVTKQTWDSYMWKPEDYCKDPENGKKLFDASAKNPLPVMIRYIVEWGAYDISERYKEITVPVLALVPDFKGVLPEDSAAIAICPKAYLKYFHQTPWDAAKNSGNPLIVVKQIPDTRLFLWYDNPEAVYTAMDEFLTNTNNKALPHSEKE